MLDYQSVARCSESFWPLMWETSLACGMRLNHGFDTRQRSTSDWLVMVDGGQYWFIIGSWNDIYLMCHNNGLQWFDSESKLDVCWWLFYWFADPLSWFISGSIMVSPWLSPGFLMFPHSFPMISHDFLLSLWFPHTFFMISHGFPIFFRPMPGTTSSTTLSVAPPVLLNSWVWFDAWGAPRDCGVELLWVVVNSGWFIVVDN